MLLRSFCSSCGRERKSFNGKPRCDCGGIFVPKINFRYRSGDFRVHYPYLEHVISLGEVSTPIVRKGHLSFKLEYFSPTFSYKDRGSKVLVSSLLENLKPGSEINEDSSGNAGASMAAYGINAGFKVNIFVPSATMPSKINQIMAYGANIITVNGTREDVTTATERHQGYFASHVLNPEFRDGMREISYEIFEQFNGKIPEYIIVPVSAGTLLLGLVSGFDHLVESGEIDKYPRIIGVQAEAVSPVCSALNGVHYDPNNGLSSIADALVSRKPPLLELIVEKMREIGGKCVTVSDSEILAARSDLALSGIYAEFSSATVYAAHKKINPSGDSLMVMTGNGLKTQ